VRLQPITVRLQRLHCDYSMNAGVYRVFWEQTGSMKNTICMHIVRRNVFSVLVMICVGERYTFIAMVFIRNLFQFICELQDSKRILHLCRHWNYVQDLMRHRGRWFFVKYDEFFVNSSLIIITKLHIFKNYSCWSMSVDWYSDELIVEELERLFP